MSTEIDWTQFTIAQINKRQLSVEDLLSHLRLSFSWQILNDLIAKQVILAEIEEREILVPEEELENFVDEFRAERSLLTAKSTEEWLEANGLDIDELYDYCEYNILCDKLKNILFDEDHVRGQYALNKAQFQKIETYQIVVKSEEKSLEIAALIKDGKNFFELAKKYSEDDNQKLCGYSGISTRAEMRAEIESKLFSKEAGDIVGPIKSLGQYHIIYIESISLEELNADIEASIREESFSKWLKRKLESSEIELYV